MMRTVEATIDEHGRVTLDEAVVLERPMRALVTIVENDLLGYVRLNEPAILAEASLAEGWSGKEADAAWTHLSELPDLGEEGR